MSYDCSVCKDDGRCLDSPSHKDYKSNNKDVWLGTDLYDCMDYHDKYIEKKRGGSWMIDWAKRLQKKEKKTTYVSDFTRWSKSVATLLFLFTMACSDVFVHIDDTDVNDDYSSNYSFTIQPNLPLDLNGYYHLTLSRATWQTLHRVSGYVSNEDGHPVEMYWVEWESDLYWYLGDTLGYIVNRHLTDNGVYVSVDTSYIIGFNGMEVPTSNKTSFSNSNGEINNMIAPVQSMIGDTLTLHYRVHDGTGYIKIVLD